MVVVQYPVCTATTDLKSVSKLLKVKVQIALNAILRVLNFFGKSIIFTLTTTSFLTKLILNLCKFRCCNFTNIYQKLNSEYFFLILSDSKNERVLQLERKNLHCSLHQIVQYWRGEHKSLLKCCPRDLPDSIFTIGNKEIDWRGSNKILLICV